MTSVGILTTGFDEPSVETIILNRATRSLTLYHQMIGRGSRIWQNKSEFTIVDLGNNVRRFGLWQDYINWNDAFKYPDRFLESKLTEDDDIEFEVEYELSPEIIKTFKDADELKQFNMKEEYKSLVDSGLKGRDAVEKSMDNHIEFIVKHAEDYYDGLDYLNVITDDIQHRLKQYAKCISKCTDNYMKWIMETYKRQVRLKLRDLLDDE